MSTPFTPSFGFIAFKAFKVGLSQSNLENQWSRMDNTERNDWERAARAAILAAFSAIDDGLTDACDSVRLELGVQEARCVP